MRRFLFCDDLINRPGNFSGRTGPKISHFHPGPLTAGLIGLRELVDLLYEIVKAHLSSQRISHGTKPLQSVSLGLLTPLTSDLSAVKSCDVDDKRRDPLRCAILPQLGKRPDEVIDCPGINRHIISAIRLVQIIFAHQRSGSPCRNGCLVGRAHITRHG